jgi:hypothetical protein
MSDCICPLELIKNFVDVTYTAWLYVTGKTQIQIFPYDVISKISVTCLEGGACNETVFLFFCPACCGFGRRICSYAAESRLAPVLWTRSQDIRYVAYSPTDRPTCPQTN